MHLKLVQPLGNILWIWTISYMELRIHFYLLCNYSQNYLLIKIPTHKNSNNIFSFQTLQLFAVAIYKGKAKTTDISRYRWTAVSMDSAFAVSVICRWPRPEKKFDILGNKRFIDLKKHTSSENRP